MAHRDDTGAGPGRERQRLGHGRADRARALVRHAPRGSRQRVEPATRSSSSPPTAARSAASARAHFAADAIRGRIVAAVVNLDALAADGRPRLVLAGDEPRSPRRARRDRRRSACSSRPGRRPDRARRARAAHRPRLPVHPLRAGAVRWPQGIPAITLTTGGERPPTAFADQRGPARPRAARPARARGAAAARARSTRAPSCAPGTASYVYLGPRIVPGWAIELVLIAALLPFLVVGGRPLRALPAPADPARARRCAATAAALGFWLWVGDPLRALRADRRLARRRRPCRFRPARAPGTDWPVLGARWRWPSSSALGWLVARERLVPRRPVSATRSSPGATAALLALGGRLAARGRDEPLRADLPAAVAARLALAAAGPAPGRSGRALAVLGAGFPGRCCCSARSRSARARPRRAVVPRGADRDRLRGARRGGVAVAWLAAAGQLAALSVGRYAPYPSARERPPRGPIRETVRRTVLTVRAARRKPAGTRARGSGRVNMRRILRITGTLMLGAGVLVLVWVLVVWRWQDPFTALYTTWKQHQLSQSYDRRAKAFRLPEPSSKTASRTRASRAAPDPRGGAPLPAGRRSAARRSGGCACRASA